MKVVTLLYMLNQFPESPKDNQQPQALPTLHQLSFQREKEIVDNLAFLSATTDDSTRVMAVCLEEARDRSSWRYAKINPASPLPVLRDVCLIRMMK